MSASTPISFSVRPASFVAAASFASDYSKTRKGPNMVISKQSDNHRHASSQKSLKMLTVETIEVHSALWIIHSTSTPFRNETVKAIEREREPAHNDDTGRSNWIREVM